MLSKVGTTLHQPSSARAQAIIPAPCGEENEQSGTAWNVISEKLTSSTPSSRGLWEKEKLWVVRDINILAIISPNVALKFATTTFWKGWVLWAGFNLNQ